MLSFEGERDRGQRARLADFAGRTRMTLALKQGLAKGELGLRADLESGVAYENRVG